MSSNNSNQQARQSRWGGSAPPPSNSNNKSSQTSAPPPRKMSTESFSSNNNNASRHPNPDRHAATQHQQHQQRRGYDMGTEYHHEEYRHKLSITASNRGGRDYYHGREDGNFNFRTERYNDDWKCQEYGLNNDPLDDYCSRNDTNNHRGRYDRGREEDWRCLECGVFNYPRDERCHRCKSFPPSDNNEAHSSPRPRKKNRRNDDREDEGDKFKDLRDRLKQRQKFSEWPPSFESGGASYIFDSRSGMFYHPPSHFFYDPKTKLYYSNRKAQYFHFVGAEDNDAIPFLPVQAGEGGGGGGGVTESSTAADSVIKEKTPSAEPGLKPKIAISLKTTVSNSQTKSLSEVAAIEKNKLKEQHKAAQKESSHLASEAASTPLIPQTQKKHEKDMEKWSGRVKELQEEDESTNASVTENTDSSAPRKIVKTRSGQPVCLLCRRKFASMEKLEQHEKFSALHKENLSKKAAKQAETDALYRDRSKERRMLYGDLAPSHLSGSSSRAEAILAQADTSRASATSMAAELVRPEDTLGDNNVGNKLLQKLGWKGGDKLGRKQDGENNSKSDRSKDAATSIKSDWERIESLAERGGRR